MVDTSFRPLHAVNRRSGLLQSHAARLALFCIGACAGAFLILGAFAALGTVTDPEVPTVQLGDMLAP